MWVFPLLNLCFSLLTMNIFIISGPTHRILSRYITNFDRFHEKGSKRRETHHLVFFLNLLFLFFFLLYNYHYIIFYLLKFVRMARVGPGPARPGPTCLGPAWPQARVRLAGPCPEGQGTGQQKRPWPGPARHVDRVVADVLLSGEVSFFFPIFFFWVDSNHMSVF